MKEDAALWRTLVPINRIKETLSCSKTSFTVVPFSDAIRSDTQVLETTRKTTASRRAPCLSNMVGTNTLHMAATLIGSALELPQSWGTADGAVCFVDGDDAITSVIYDCAFEFENAESFLCMANAL
ncbi:hypothetical protein V8G54_004438 [Vigna mungo]|uniref:Uncharacterized protein n=1 Tax=Vigna mungo TaxID=3915 RepID=A0AAQ3SFS0_VIGMU